MKIKIKGFITSKKNELYSDCADNYNFSQEYNKFAISDGVSKSFFPKIWSKHLVKNYVFHDHLNQGEFIKKSQEDWQEEVDIRMQLENVKYYTRNAYNNKVPGLATFVGLQFLVDKKTWTAQALGDSFLFFVPRGSTQLENETTILSSKSQPIVFDNFPDYLSSIGNNHKGHEEKIIDETLAEGTFYLMTDALAEWFLKGIGIKQAIEKLENIATQEHFLFSIIEDERNSNRLNDDDSAILIIELSDDGKEHFSYSEVKVSMLSDLIKKEQEDLEGKNDPHFRVDEKLHSYDIQKTGIAEILGYVSEEPQITQEGLPSKEVIYNTEQATTIDGSKGENNSEVMPGKKEPDFDTDQLETKDQNGEMIKDELTENLSRNVETIFHKF
ncbi:hypothetical protein [Dyadobacter chenhuakuii]|uniref:Protein phosphatase 2C-like protein n=1 Tax=Dyadobacter chenhuakuii TaxID=2909339 RepID=A0ABY4XMK2_9BACT|nr:hypothetical protein [Dyadobacter chenhuakuii]MCF2494270.1 hypothetical protein [Dyadobacter chenhuakuii]USJ31395.1 hypothetical protein NFI80_01375 [Dyadobacter chenhuakuii]